MARETRNAVLVKELQSLFEFGVVCDSSDRQLLDRFLAADHVEAEAAFTTLVERHGPMVLQICRQVLDDSHDAQDAFQATFLVFLHRARSIRKRDSLASWLFGVAMRVARRARHAAIVRRFHERQAGDVAAAAAPSSHGDRDRLAALHDEVARLPASYREPIVLCHLEGLSTAAVAERLGCAQGTVLSRLARGRERLRRRLVQQGNAESMGLLVPTSMPSDPLTVVSATLVNSTVQYAMRALSGCAALAATISPSVAVLTQVTLRTLFMTRMSLAAAVLGTGVAMTVATISTFRTSMGAGLQARFIDAGTEQHSQKSPRIELGLVHSRDLEDALYKILKQDHEFDDPRWPFVIKVRDVQAKSLIDATFKHRTMGKVNEYDAIIQARRAVIRFDPDAKTARIFLEHVEIQHFTRDADIVLINEDTLVIPIPPTDLLMPQRTSPTLGESAEDQVVLMDSDQAVSLG
jgi:RNA polymerase sigma factor (sigma-70 family)